MAFRTNKVPAIEERTVSGSSVVFNSAFALPLKACKVSFSATQAGSGDPSPSNPRAISGVSAIGLNANSTPVSVSLGDTRYGGVLDVLTGILTVTHRYRVFNGSENWTAYGANGSYLVFDDMNGSALSGISNYLPTINSVAKFGVMFGNNNGVFYAMYRDQISEVTNNDTWKTYLSTHNLEVVYPLAEPITIQLSANELSSIIGNNTFSTDTGTLEITFADLQEKSASGSVASFNTALAMPLASCNIAVNAWQEGSGDPSPVNVRPIHGFSEVNTTRAGKNLIDVSKNIIGAYINSNGVETTAGAQSWAISDYIPVAKGGVYTFNPNSTEGISAKGAFYDKNKQYLPNSVFNSGAKTITVPTNAFYVRFSMRTTSYDVQLEAGSTATAYEPYVTPTIYTIQLGQEVYGAEVDVNGVAHCNHIIVDFSTLTFTVPLSSFPHYFRTQIWGANAVRADVICDVLKTVPQAIDVQNTNLSITKSDGYNFYIHDDECNSNDDIHAKYDGHKICYGLTNPFDIQLTPTQIETLIGNNTIFADTGDIDLTYKDLDIAKRGNFREVFKLPS